MILLKELTQQNLKDLFNNFSKNELQQLNIFQFLNPNLKDELFNDPNFIMNLLFVDHYIYGYSKCEKFLCLLDELKYFDTKILVRDLFCNSYTYFYGHLGDKTKYFHISTAVNFNCCFSLEMLNLFKDKIDFPIDKLGNKICSKNYFFETKPFKDFENIIRNDFNKSNNKFVFEINSFF